MDKLKKKKKQGRQRQRRDCVSVQMSMSMQGWRLCFHFLRNFPLFQHEINFSKENVMIFHGRSSASLSTLSRLSQGLSDASLTTFSNTRCTHNTRHKTQHTTQTHTQHTTQHKHTTHNTHHCLTPAQKHAQCNIVTLGRRLPIQPSAVGNRSLMWPYHITRTPGCSTPLCSVPQHCTQGR